MKSACPAVALLAIAATVPSAAPAQETTVASAIQAFQRIVVQYGVLLTRSFVDLTYETISIEQGTGDVVVTGLRLFPELEWDPEGRCIVTVDRLIMADANSLEVMGSAIALGDVTLPPACLQPEAAEALAAFGYDGLTVENAAIDIEYHLPSSAADLTVAASVADAAEIGLTAHFDYVWVRVPVGDPTDPEAAAAGAEPVARLGHAELVVENRGLWDALEPMLSEQMGGDLSSLPEIVQMMLGDMLSQGGTRTPGDGETAFVTELGEQVARFVEDRDRIVMTVAPEGGSVLLTEELLASPEALIEALDPVVSAVPDAWRRMIPPEQLSAALAGGESLDDATRLAVGEALVTGIGAPRSPDAGRALLAPLVEAWDARAALSSARAERALGNGEEAYAAALRAMAGGEAAAIGMADEIEADLPLAVILAAQEAAAGAWPNAGAADARAGALIAAGDVGGMRREAQAAATGRGRPRDYAEAYYWASLAAAAGDRGAAAVRDRLDARFADQPGWAAATSVAADRALDTWTGGLAGTLAARMQ